MAKHSQKKKQTNKQRNDGNETSSYRPLYTTTTHASHHTRKQYVFKTTKQFFLQDEKINDILKPHILQLSLKLNLKLEVTLVSLI